MRCPEIVDDRLFRKLPPGHLYAAFYQAQDQHADRRRLISADHFSVDGTLLEAWASLKSYRPRDEQEPPATPGGGGRNTEVDFRGQRRRRETHVSRTDAEA